MKKTLTTAAALVACVGTTLFAQKAKEDVLTFSLTLQRQNSISTSGTVNNAGLWSQLSATPGKAFYKSATEKLATANILRAIGFTLHDNANFYSSRAQLVLVQGELGGFFNLQPELADTVGYYQQSPGEVPGQFDATPFPSTIDALFIPQATGRHFDDLDGTIGWPPGHHQPWGQIFVKDRTAAGTVILCENVTFFFALMVQECYDCFYLNSFVTDTTFTFKAVTGGSGPPCCHTVGGSTTGNGKDRYYLTLSFDDTDNNPYLYLNSPAYVGVPGSPWEGLRPANDFTRYVTPFGFLPADGLVPDIIEYEPTITLQNAFPNAPYIMRFTLNGILTYTWNLKLINPNDLSPDFVGTGSYAANGYGFNALYCILLNGTVGFAEKIVNASTCCLDLPWYDSFDAGIGLGIGGGWFGIGWNQSQSPWESFFPSPINVYSDLTIHVGFDEEYGPGEQWLTNPTPDVGGRQPFPVPQHIPVGEGPVPVTVK